MADVALLLGAGASKEAGCPLVTEFRASFGAFLSTRANSERLLAAYEWLLGCLDERSPATLGAAQVDIELILSSLRSLIDRESSALSAFVHTSGWRKEVKEFDTEFVELEALVQRHIREECEVSREDVNYLRPLRDFLPPGASLDVFTLNYDYTIELVCQEMNVPCTDGFGTYWEPSRFEAASRGVKLHKLHGSLLWYRTSRSPQRLVKIPVNRITDSEVRFFSDDAVSTSVIYPALAKELHVDPYATLVARFRSVLDEVDNLVVIGYSFRDRYMKDLILEKMRDNESLRLVFVAPDPVRVLKESDTAFASPPTFAGVANRIILVPTTAGTAFANGLLARRLSAVAEGHRATVDAENLRLSHSRDVRVASCVAALGLLIQAEDVGAITLLMEDDTEGLWHDAAQAVGGSAGERLAAAVLSLPGASLRHKRSVSDLYRQTFNEVSQYAVRRVSNGFQALGSNLGTPRFGSQEALQDWFSSKARAVRLVREALEPYTGYLSWYAPSVHKVCSEIRSDLVALETYFLEVVQAQRYLMFQSTRMERGNFVNVAFPRPEGEAVIDQLTARLVGDRPKGAEAIVSAFGPPH